MYKNLSAGLPYGTRHTREMDTGFDPSEIIGKQAWELARHINDHFAGWEEVDEQLSDQEWNELVASIYCNTSIACQTPAEWAYLEPAQKEKEPAPESPPVRLVVLRPGMQRPTPRLSRP